MIARLLSIRPGEGRLVLRLGMSQFLMLATIVVHLTVAEAIFIAAFAPSRLPFAYLGGAVLGALASAGYAGLRRRMDHSPYRGFVWVALATLFVLLRFAAVELREWGPVLVLLAVPTVIAILGIENAALATRSLDPRSARRLFPGIGALGGLGAVSGGLLIAFGARPLGVREILWFCAAFALGSLAVGRAGPPNRAGTTPPARSGWGTAVRYRFAVLMMLLVFLGAFLTTGVRYQLSTCVKEALTPEQIAPYLGYLNAALNGVSVLFPLLLMRWILRRVGVGASLALYPGILLAASVGILLVPSLAAVSMALFLERSLRYNLQRPLLHIAAMSLPDGIRSRILPALAGGIEAVGISVASLAILLGASSVAWPQISVAVAAFALGALACGLLARKGYVRELSSALHARRLRLEERGDWNGMVDKTAEDLFHRHVESETSVRVVLALEMVKGRWSARTLALVRKQWPTWEEWVKLEALRSLAAEATPEGVEFVRGLRGEGVEVEAASLRTGWIEMGEEELRRKTEEGPMAVRREAMVLGWRRWGWEPVRGELEKWIQSGDPEQMRAAAYVLGQGEEAEAKEMLADLSEVAREEVMEAVARKPEKRFADLCVRRLAEERTYGSAREALRKLGEEAREALEKGAREEGVGGAVVELMGEIEACRGTLLEMVTGVDVEMRYRAGRALGRRGGTRKEEQGAVTAALLREMEECGTWRKRMEEAAGGEREEAEGEYEWSVERMMMLLGLLDPHRPYRRIYLSWASEDRAQRSYALELLDEMLEGPLRQNVMGVLEGKAGERKEGIERDLSGGTAVALKKAGIFRWWRLRDLEVVGRRCREIAKGGEWPKGGEGWLVVREGEVVEPERAILEGGVPDPGDERGLAVPLEWVYRVIGRHPRCGPAWLRGLAMRLGAAEAGSVDVSRSGLSLASRAQQADRFQALEPSLWQRVFFLRGVSLFFGLSSERLRQIAELSKTVSAGQGEMILKEGRLGGHFYVLCGGRAEVRMEGRVVSHLNPGDAFGELALLTGQARRATIRATESCDLLTLDRVDFLDLLHLHPSLVKSFSRVIAARTLGTSA